MLEWIGALPLDIDVNTNTAVGPAFVASLATLVIAFTGLVKAIPLLRRVEEKANGNLEAERERADRLHNQLTDSLAKLDDARTTLSQQRRTIERLLERE